MNLKTYFPHILTKNETIRMIGIELYSQLEKVDGYIEQGRDERAFYTHCKDDDVKHKINEFFRTATLYHI
jgi:hypothetical protein